MEGFGKFFVILGGIFILVGLFFLLFPKLPVFRLPGDIVIQKENFSFYFPIVSCILISVILSLILNIIFRR